MEERGFYSGLLSFHRGLEPFCLSDQISEHSPAILKLFIWTMGQIFFFFLKFGPCDELCVTTPHSYFRRAHSLLEIHE